MRLDLELDHTVYIPECNLRVSFIMPNRVDGIWESVGICHLET